MTQYFSGDYLGAPFKLFGPEHLMALTVILLFNLFLIRFKNSDQRTRTTIRWSLAIILWLDELAWHIWNLEVGKWNFQNLLPLNICSILIWLSGFMLIFRNYPIYEFAYFLGIGGGLQYLLTPDLGIYGFPHFRFFQTFISHGLLVTSPIYMTFVENFRPTWKSVYRVVLWSNIYMGLVFIINSFLGSNYLMINGKPSTFSIFNYLPPWPYYIFFMELIGLATILILFLPFFIKDR